MDSVQKTGEKAACLHDATSAFNHDDNLDGQRAKQGNTRRDRAAMVDWTPHEVVTRQATKATLSCLLVTKREGALVSGTRIQSKDT